MENTQKSGWLTSRLPWLLAGGALVLFLATLNPWVSLASLGLVAKITGWDWWTPTLQSPVLLTVTYPVRWLPAGMQPVALNVFTAACAALTLGILGRSIQLLPHDRTKEQRWLNRHPRGLLMVRWAWVPVVFGVLVCGLEQTFWEHATAASEEMFDLLLFAAVVWCLLEHRDGGGERWLHAFACLYALGMANNWAMIAFLPLFGVALVWMKGLALFRGRLLLGMGAWAAAGLTFYLVLPWVMSGGPDAPAGFWGLLRTSLGMQKNLLFQYPKGRALLLSVTSVLPVLIMGIRWAASLGDANALSNRLTTVMFCVVHVVFLVACTAVAFNLAFSPRALGYGLAFLPFYYLGALSIGYFSGYLLLVFGEESPNAWERPKGVFKLVYGGLVALVFFGAVGVPAVLFLRNLPAVQFENGPALKTFANRVAESVPREKAIILGDDASWLVLATAAQPALAVQNLVVDKRSLGVPLYHRMLHRRAPELWPDWFGGKLPTNGLSQAFQTQVIARLALTNAVYHFRPAPGNQLFELMQARPSGLASRLVVYPQLSGLSAAGGAGGNPTRYKLNSKAHEAAWGAPLTGEDVRVNEQFWQAVEPSLAELERTGALRSRTREVLVASYSQAINTWGVELQRSGMLAEAAGHFARAAALNPNNEVAAINLRVNRQLAAGAGRAAAADAETDARLARQRTWVYILASNGPVDEPRYCTQIGEAYARGTLYRQAAQHFLRAVALDGTAFEPRAALAEVFTQVRMPELALEVIRDTRVAGLPALKIATNEVTLACAEAVALFNLTNAPAADKILQAVQEKHPRDPRVPATMTKLHIAARQMTNALVTVERELSLSPNNPRALLNKGAILVELKRYEQAVVPLDTLLRSRPEHAPALLNRSIALLNLNRLDAAQRDCEALKRLEPNLTSPYIGLAEVALRRQRTNDAVGWFESARKLVPTGSAEGRSLDKRIAELKGVRR